MAELYIDLDGDGVDESPVFIRPSPGESGSHILRKKHKIYIQNNTDEIVKRVLKGVQDTSVTPPEMDFVLMGRITSIRGHKERLIDDVEIVCPFDPHPEFNKGIREYWNYVVVIKKRGRAGVSGEERREGFTTVIRDVCRGT